MTPSPRPDCSVLRPLLDAAEQTQRDVEAGTTFSAYSDDVTAFDTLYRRLDLTALRAAGGRCVDVGVMLEAAHNWHAQALAAWAKCLPAGNSAACAAETVRPLWQRAAADTTKAAAALR